MNPDELRSGMEKLMAEHYEHGLNDSLVALKASVEMMAEQVPQSMFSYRDFAQFIDLAIAKLSKTEKFGG